MRSPWYSGTLANPVVAETDPVYPNRSGFGNHMFVVCDDKIFDATSGYAKGERSKAVYFDMVIDPVDRANVGGVADTIEPYTTVR
jgi:hypothetical protein